MIPLPSSHHTLFENTQNLIAVNTKEAQRQKKWDNLKVWIKLHNAPGPWPLHMRANVFPLTTEDIRTDVGRTPSLVFQEVILTHQMLSQAEVCDGNPVSPGCTPKQQIT